MHRLFTTACLSLATVTAYAQTELQTYVTRCQNELQFSASEVKPMKCTDGFQFATNGGRGPVNDFVVHKRVNQNVDQVAACRWGDGTSTLTDNTKFVQIELIIHNRANGGTCFFAAADLGSDPKKPVSNSIVSPTNFSAAYPNANNFWLTPTQLNSKLLLSDLKEPVDHEFKEQLQCVRCHSQGPYIASKRIAPLLANMGLLNDGHHTHSDFSAPNHYYVVGSNSHTDPNSGTHPFKNWNYLIARNNQDPAVACSTGCHARARDDKPADGSFSPIGSLIPVIDRGTIVLPSIAFDVFELDNCCMPPDDEFGAWRWINIDQPSSDSAEVETFTASKKMPVISSYCPSPGWIEASAVETNTTFSNLAIGFMPNKLRAFNLRDGLTCMNADQPGGARCYDHQVSYKCPGPQENWTPYYNKDTNTTDDGDHEERSRAIADATAFCGGKTPIAMRAQATVNGTTIPANAPNDRLAQFSRTGLVCRNSDQGSGQSCSNYVVRYHDCNYNATLSKIKNAWTNPPTFGDRYLTTTNNVDGAETRAQAGNYQYPSQDWTIEPVSGGNTVRLADVWSGKYLTASSNTDQAVVQVKTSDMSQMRQQWVMETVSGSSEVRFRNVGTGRYLTVGNYTGSDPYYAPIYSQSLSSQNWASQRWVVQ
jgi:hypothetical protein